MKVIGVKLTNTFGLSSPGNLVEAALAIVDSDHDSLFLNAYTESNVRFYERFGFKVEAEATLSDRTPGIWLGM